jgi:hypothetical protein
MLGKKDFGMKEKELDGVFIHSFWIFFFLRLIYFNGLFLDFLKEVFIFLI